MEVNPIGIIYTDFETKFGVPRQAGIVSELSGRIELCPPYRTADALRGLEDFSHLWLLWEFTGAEGTPYSPTVRPPRLGGNERVGVFASRSPFRPNHIGLSSVELDRVEYGSGGPVIYVRGADLMSGTPILDIKPYLPYTDSHPEATGGFTDTTVFSTLQCDIPDELASKLPKGKLEALCGVLENDPRPHYQKDPERVYGFSFAGCEVRFRVEDGFAKVVDIS